MNNDGNDAELWLDFGEGNLPPNRLKQLYASTDEGQDRTITPQEFLDRRTTALAGTNVDAIFYCDGYFNAYQHQSDFTELKSMSHPGRINLATGLIKKYGKDPLTY